MTGRFNAKVLTAVLLTLSLTACSDAGAQISTPTYSGDTSDAATDTRHTTDDDRDSNEAASGAAEYNPNNSRIEEYASDNPVNVYEAVLRNGDTEYDCTVYIYRLTEETDDTYRGDCAIEISDGGSVIDRTMLLVGYTLGQMGTEFAKDGSDGYFSVIELDSGSLLLSTRDDGDTTQATLYAVNGGRIEQIERYFADPADRPDKGAQISSFNLSRDYITDGDNIIFKINGDKVTVTIDFNELTLKCDEDYEWLVYCG